MIMNGVRPSTAGCLVIGLALVAGLPGCGGGAEAGTEVVQGMVTVDDKPISQAAVAFIGNEGASLAAATTDSAGKFNLRAATGKNVVTVAKAPPSGAASLPASSEPQLMPSAGEYAAMTKSLPASEVPAKYGDPKTSGIAFDVKSGMPPIDVALTSK